MWVRVCGVNVNDVGVNDACDHDDHDDDELALNDDGNGFCLLCHASIGDDECTCSAQAIKDLEAVKEYQERDNKYGEQQPVAEDAPPEHSVAAFIRWLKLQPDGASAVFKNKHMLAALGMFVLLDLVSAISLDFMTPGHTKFDPDLIAAILGRMYNKSEVFNLGMFLEIVQEECARAQSYNSAGLIPVRSALDNTGVVSAIPGIRAPRSFLLVSADQTFNEKYDAKKKRRDRYTLDVQAAFPPHVSGETKEARESAGNYFPLFY